VKLRVISWILLIAMVASIIVPLLNAIAAGA